MTAFSTPFSTNPAENVVPTVLLRIVLARPSVRPAALRQAAAAWASLLSMLALVGLLLALLAPAGVRAQGVELTNLTLQKLDAGLTLDFNTRISLPPAVQDAVQRGVPLYFVAEATVYRYRWYWRDDRVTRASRSWRLSYQPLSDSWRISLGGLAQTHATLQDALTAMSSAARWKIADHSQIDPDERYYVEFSYKLDTSQLPRPMQFGIGGQADWSLGVERTLRVD